MAKMVKWIPILAFLCLPTYLFGEEKHLPFQISNLDFPVSLDSNDTAGAIWFLKLENEFEIAPNTLNKENFNPESWKKVIVPGNLIKQKPELAGKNTIVLATWITLPPMDAGNLSIRLGIINDSDEVYWNGKLIGATGNWNSALPQAYDKIRIYAIPNQYVNYGKDNLLVIRIKPFFTSSLGIEQDFTAIGHTHQILKNFYIDEFVKVFFQVVYVTVGVYFLFLFSRRRKESENLFFGLFSIFLVIYNILRNQIKYEFGIPFLFMKRLEYSVLLMLVPLMFHFIRKLFSFRYQRIHQIVDIAQFSFFLIFVFDSNIEHYHFLMTRIIQPSWILYVCFLFYFLFKRIYEKNRQAYVVTIGLMIVIAASAVDIFSTRGYFVFPRVLGYAFLAFNVSLATVLANSFVKVHEEVENLNKNLESIVKERTNELNQTLKEVQSLKEQQDGDYFLTSLMIHPLAKNENKSKFVKTEFYTKQKKTFEFNGKKNEIGGDISIADQIQLNGEPFVVFVNGDAMGKSIQGAGGALVLGVVFHAVVSRTKALPDFHHGNPETWLKDLFLELQGSFESFDGSMLTSIVAGVISERTGELYYINAEHPWSILYRDKKATFLEKEMWMRKLGFPKNSQNFSILKFQLKPEDILICGTDGRDDIYIRNALDKGESFFNEDSNLILGWIEKSKANLEETTALLQEFGELTDDLTFLKITYKSRESQVYPE